MIAVSSARVSGRASSSAGVRSVTAETVLKLAFHINLRQRSR
jgi:hypothetical protein